MDESPKEIPPAVPPSPATEAVPTAPQPWGFWATSGFTVLILIVYLVAQGVSAALCFVVFNLDEDQTSGLLLAVATLAGAPAGIGITCLFARLRGGIRIRDYLGLHWPPRRTVVQWCLVLLAFAGVSDVLTVFLLDRPLVPPVMVDFYRTAGFLPLLWLAIVIVGPATEEVIIRGFMIPGLLGERPSQLATGAAIAISSALWAVIHVQYDAFGVGVIFMFGILLGYVRVSTGSLPLCILLHLLSNLISTVEVTILLGVEKG
jgi:membrane protease YdiL (CAAX protease family)